MNKLIISWLFLTTLLCLSFTSQSFAHHSIVVGFNEEKRVFIHGKVNAYHLLNPHSFMYVDVLAADGLPTRYKIQFDNSTGLKKNLGWTKETFKKGDAVEISGFPARKGFKIYGCAISKNGQNTMIINYAHTARYSSKENKMFHLKNLEKEGLLLQDDSDLDSTDLVEAQGSLK